MLKALKRIWIKIGPRYRHTHERFLDTEIIKLDGELRLEEVMMIWRREKDKVPKGLKDIIVDKLVYLSD